MTNRRPRPTVLSSAQSPEPRLSGFRPRKRASNRSNRTTSPVHEIGAPVSWRCRMRQPSIRRSILLFGFTVLGCLGVALLAERRPLGRRPSSRAAEARTPISPGVPVLHPLPSPDVMVACTPILQGEGAGRPQRPTEANRPPTIPAVSRPMDAAPPQLTQDARGRALPRGYIQRRAQQAIAYRPPATETDPRQIPVQPVEPAEGEASAADEVLAPLAEPPENEDGHEDEREND